MPGLFCSLRSSLPSDDQTARAGWRSAKCTRHQPAPWDIQPSIRIPALGRCLSVIIRAIQTNLAHRAGLTASAGARTGVVTLIQRFGSALNLNIHLHMLILDRVYTMEQNGPRFHRVGAPDPQTLERLLNRLVQRIVRRLTRDGLLIQDPDQPWLNLEPSDSLDQLNAASIRYRIAVGQGAGGRTLTLKNPALVRTNSTPKPFTANQNGFSLNCAVACQAHQRDRLERLCRYITRPALCLERLSTNAAGQVGSSRSELLS